MAMQWAADFMGNNIVQCGARRHSPSCSPGSAAFLDLYSTQPLLPLLRADVSGASTFAVGLTVTAPTSRWRSRRRSSAGSPIASAFGA